MARGFDAQFQRLVEHVKGATRQEITAASLKRHGMDGLAPNRLLESIDDGGGAALHYIAIKGTSDALVHTMKHLSPDNNIDQFPTQYFALKSGKQDPLFNAAAYSLNIENAMVLASFIVLRYAQQEGAVTSTNATRALRKFQNKNFDITALDGNDYAALNAYATKLKTQPNNLDTFCSTPDFTSSFATLVPMVEERANTQRMAVVQHQSPLPPAPSVREEEEHKSPTPTHAQIQASLRSANEQIRRAIAQSQLNQAQRQAAKPDPTTPEALRSEVIEQHMRQALLEQEAQRRKIEKAKDARRKRLSVPELPREESSTVPLQLPPSPDAALERVRRRARSMPTPQGSQRDTSAPDQTSLSSKVSKVLDSGQKDIHTAAFDYTKLTVEIPESTKPDLAVLWSETPAWRRNAERVAGTQPTPQSSGPLGKTRSTKSGSQLPTVQEHCPPHAREYNGVSQPAASASLTQEHGGNKLAPLPRRQRPLLTQQTAQIPGTEKHTQRLAKARGLDPLPKQPPQPKIAAHHARSGSVPAPASRAGQLAPLAAAPHRRHGSVSAAQLPPSSGELLNRQPHQKLSPLQRLLKAAKSSNGVGTGQNPRGTGRS